MSEEPFQNYPVPELFFKSRSHQSGWRYLLLGIKAREPYLMATGEYGAGKTLLCLRLLKGMLQKPEYFPHVFISTPNSSYVDILKKIGGALGVPHDIDSESSLQRNILEIFERQENPGPFFLIIDDVQDMAADTLHNIRLFANFSCNGVFPFRLILFGHTSFLKRLKSPTLGPLDQRIKRRFHLASLEPEETKEYIYFRLLNSGARGRPFFDDGAVLRIHSRSCGVPRVINNLCDACLLIGAGEGLGVIDEQTVKRAEAYLGLTEEAEGSVFTGDRKRDEHDHLCFPAGDGKIPASDGEGQKEGLPRAGEGIDFAGMPDGEHSEHLDQVVSGGGERGGSQLDFWRTVFLRRKGRYLLVLLLVILVFVLGFFWQRYSLGVSLGLTSSSEELPSLVDGEIALWLPAKGEPEGNSQNLYLQAPKKRSITFEDAPGGNRPMPQTGADIVGKDSKQSEVSAAGRGLSHSDGVLGHASAPEVLHLKDREYTLVLSSCRKRESALAVLDGLGADGRFEVGLGQIAYDGGEPWWVVHRGTYASREEASSAGRALHLQDTLVRKLPYLVVDKRLETLAAAEDRWLMLKVRGEYAFLVDEGEQVNVCLGKYDTAERACGSAVEHSP